MNDYAISFIFSAGVMVWARWYVRRSIKRASNDYMKKVMPEGWTRKEPVKRHHTVS